MGEIREGLGEMADPADLVTALVEVGLLKRAFTGTELAAETSRAGGAELFRLEMAHAWLGPPTCRSSWRPAPAGDDDTGFPPTTPASEGQPR
ncbi:MAG TPA: hypothetical protein VMV92_39920 [Streptosporangiaceae bacterium]|nr:hypothetical protein [Streptosporangiaceae bacterium]